MMLGHEDYRKVLSSVPIVCVDCLVVNDSGEFLLVKRRNEPLKGQFWIPGGRLHKSERLTDAVHRKMREEIGVDVEILENVGFFEEFFDRSAENVEGGVHSISIVYVVRPLSYVIRLDGQSDDWGWFKKLPAQFRNYGDIRARFPIEDAAG